MAINLHIKNGIQPFEEKLAMKEISSISGVNIELIPEDRLISINPKKKNFLQRCLSQLVFTDYVLNGNGEKLPTAQHLREVGHEGKFNRRRNLRFGVHDLHEYKAKFWPQFVRAAINIESPNISNCLVLDPMMGSGTTAVEALSLDHQVIGFDINPLSCLITEAKIILNSMNSREIDSLFDSLSRLDTSIKVDIEEIFHSKVLDYLKLWFNIDDLVDLVKLRIQIEALPTPVSKVGLVLLSDVINPISHQKESEQRPIKEEREYLEGETLRLFKSKIEMMNQRIKLSHNSSNFSGTSNIHNISYLKSSEIVKENSIDIIVTSPPYFTAMPYLIADRLNLFVLGLAEKSEVMKEEGMIGSREASAQEFRDLWLEFQKSKDDFPDSVRDLIELTSANFHGDKEGIGQRRKVVPELLHRYFRDMKRAIELNFTQLKEGGVMWMLVGNNFSKKPDGEKIVFDTPSLICDIAMSVGFETVEIIDTEIPKSREIYSGNQGSSERILILRKNQGIGISSITEFTTEWDFHDEGDIHPLHSLHSYPAKFNAHIPRKAILDFTSRGDTVLDPFCGSGTALLEAKLHGRNSIGVDNNQVAALISETKTTQFLKGDEDELDKEINRIIESYHHEDQSDWSEMTPDYENIEYWFEPQAIIDLSRLKTGIMKTSNLRIRGIFLSVFSHIIVNASNQDSDTRYSRQNREYSVGSAIKSWHRKIKPFVKHLGEMIPQSLICGHPKESGELCRRISKDGKACHKHRTSHDVHVADSKDLSQITDNSVDFIVTSPPYMNAYDYHKYHRHRLHWIGGDVKTARDKEIGKHDKYSRPGVNPMDFIDNLEVCMSEWFRVLKPNSCAVVIIGDSIVEGRFISVGLMLIERALSLGFELEFHKIRNLKLTSKNFNAGARTKQEHVICFRKV